LVFLIAPSNPASAQLQEESLIVIDTALNSDQADIAANIKYEVCILDWSACPNGQSFMEGKGSAYLSPRFMSSNGFNHGSQMVSAALKTNPNLQIIFIRIVGSSNSGARLNVSPLVVAKALKWVSDNKERFQIGAVAMSQGHHNLSVLTRYCPTESPVESMIELLLQKGVPVFVPAGNSRDYERLDWPACIPSTISIGALDSNRQIASYGNIDSKLLDYFEIGDLKVKDFDGLDRTATGTSISVQIAAAKWMQFITYYPNLSNEDRLQEFDRFTRPVSNSQISNGKAIPEKIEDPEIKINRDLEQQNELSTLKSMLQDLRNLIQLLLTLITKD
jgi:hypothetical protein